jgi:type VI secretion system protein ImpM
MTTRIVRPGVFGKLPARADFVARGLPASFTDPWHRWLVRGLTAARRELATAFEPAYMTAPFWRFVIPPGACGPAPAAGILLPSVDAVGRLFPLTLGAVSPLLMSSLVLASAQSWFQMLEEAGRDALTVGPDVEAWIARVAGMTTAIPPVVTAPGCVHVLLPDGVLEPAVLPALAALGTKSAVLFWSEGSPLVRACALVAQEMLDGIWFARLLSDAVASVEDAL